MVAALIALLMVIHVWWEKVPWSAGQSSQDLCIFNGIILLISVYELVAHGGLTAYRDENAVALFRWASGHDPLLIWLPCLVLTLIPMIVYFRTKRITPAD